MFNNIFLNTYSLEYFFLVASSLKYIKFLIPCRKPKIKMFVFLNEFNFDSLLGSRLCRAIHLHYVYQICKTKKRKIQFVT